MTTNSQPDAPKTAGVTEDGAGAPDERRSRLGIGGKLLCAFAGVASLTLAASVVAFFSYFYIGRSLHRIDVEGIPTIASAFTLARQAAELSAISSSLAAVDDRAELTQEMAQLRAERGRIDDTLKSLDLDREERPAIVKVGRHVDELLASADQLAASIAQRLRAASERRRLAKAVVAAHGALMARLAPMADDAGFDLVTSLQSAAKDRDRAALSRTLNELSNVEAPTLQALSGLRSDGNLVLGILTEVSLAPNIDFLSPLRDSFTARSYSAREAVKDIGAQDVGGSLHAALEDLLAYGKTGGGLFEVRRNELELTARSIQLAANVQSRIAALALEVQQFVTLAQAISSAAVSASSEAILESQIALLGLIGLSLASAVLLAWGLVGKGILRRLQALNKAMLALAAGDLDTAIPCEGEDEIYRMAKAVEVFKRNAIRRQELEAEKERDRIEDLRRREASFRLLFEDNPLPMWVYDAESLELLSVNEAAADHYGHRREAFASMNVRDICPPDERIEFVEFLSAASADRRNRTRDESWRQLKADGSCFEGAVYARALPYENRAAALAVVIDVTERKRAEACVVHMAHHDALTNLPNRVLFRQRLDEALARMRRENRGIAIHCLDLDRFKNVNDTLGHPIGDALLQEVSKRILGCVRETDTVSRLGGDEFAIVQDAVDTPEQAGMLASQLLETIAEPYQFRGHDVIANVSIGIALAPNDGKDPDALLKNADMALYRAKSDGRGAFRFFEPEMDARLQDRRLLEMDLRGALQRKQFELHYQPQVDLRTGDVLGFEALIRWRHPERGTVSPLEFIPLAEEIGLISGIGDWVVRQACAQAATWPEGITVAINLSPAQFINKNLAQSIISALASSGLAANRLELEVTESILLQESESTLNMLHQLRALGVRIAMDDFGTGYSSLSYLRRFPFDRIKIDRSFVNDMEKDGGCAAIVRSVAGLAEGLHMTTTAEGVETQDQLDLLLAEGYSEGQGYLFSRPLPVEAVEGFIREHGGLRNASRPCEALESEEAAEVDKASVEDGRRAVGAKRSRM